MKAYQIRIELIGSDPLIWRRVVMPADATFNRLNDIIQNVSNFKSGYPYSDYHLYEFYLPDEDIRVTNDDEAYQEYKYYKNNPDRIKEYVKNIPEKFEEIRKRRIKDIKTIIRKPVSIKIDKYLKKYGQLNYTYDYGDNWQFLIILENIIEDYPHGFPVLTDGEETAPPEDVGGLGGYYNFLEIYLDPEHPEHEYMKTWAESLGYKEFDKQRINKILKSIKYK
ncbi:MAG: plasmid pRiA4b ORF-3 family protein [bacterium]